MFSFITAFLILAPTLIFYSSGYRYDFKRNKILKTGTLMIEAKNIHSANLFINDQQHEELFNEKIFIYNLLPGEYQIKLTKEGFHPWQKKITINSSLTTFAKNVIVFKKNVPLQIIDGQIPNFYISPDKQKIAYLLKTDSFLELYIYDTETKQEELAYRTSAAEKNINVTWAASSKKILVKNNNTYLVFDVQNLQQGQALNELISFPPINMKWDIKSDNLLYTQANNSIYKIDLLAKSIWKILDNETQTIDSEFFIEGNDIFYIQKDKIRDTLYKYNLNFQTTRKILDLNKSNNYQFLQSTNNFLGLIDLDLQKLYLIQKIRTDLKIDITAKEPIKEFEAKNAFWDEAEEQLLIYNDFEIFTYKVKTGDEFFINRYGQEIKKATWYPKLQYIVILFKGNLQIIDLNMANGTRNVIEIIKFDQLHDFSLDNKGKSIYFNGKIGKQQGLYQIEIK